MKRVRNTTHTHTHTHGYQKRRPYLIALSSKSKDGLGNSDVDILDFSDMKSFEKIKILKLNLTDAATRREDRRRKQESSKNTRLE